MEGEDNKQYHTIFKLSSNNDFDNFCAKPSMLQTQNFLQNENHTINKKVMGVWSMENGIVWGKKWLWEFYTSNSTEITFAVQFWT